MHWNTLENRPMLFEGLIQKCISSYLALLVNFENFFLMLICFTSLPEEMAIGKDTIVDYNRCLDI